jgi:hypothetical protein
METPSVIEMSGFERKQRLEQFLGGYYNKYNFRIETDL